MVKLEGLEGAEKEKKETRIREGEKLSSSRDDSFVPQ